MKLEVGMYVRTKEGEIGKVIPNGMIEFPKDYAKIEYLIIGGEITKASHNIIDLIEVGDYVNGYKVLFAGAITWDNDGNVLEKRVHINQNGRDIWLMGKYIKSIVTKEQFESMAYKVV